MASSSYRSTALTFKTTQHHNSRLPLLMLKVTDTFEIQHLTSNGAAIARRRTYSEPCRRSIIVLPSLLSPQFGDSVEEALYGGLLRFLDPLSSHGVLLLVLPEIYSNICAEQYLGFWLDVNVEVVQVHRRTDSKGLMIGEEVKTEVYVGRSRDDDEGYDCSSCCAVCLEEFWDGTEVSRLPCDHIFHGACIGEWALRKNSCPLCRQQFYF